MAAAIHLHPTAPLAARVLLPGDPGRALLLAQALLEQPKMFNHHRGLWGYTGVAPDGEPLTIQSTGMGGPSAAIVATELAELGARQLVRIGTCGALEPGLSLGDLLIASEALSADGTSSALASSGPLAPSPRLLGALAAAAGEGVHLRAVVSVDLYYGERKVVNGEASAIDMETATLFALGAVREELEVASLLIVSEVLTPTRTRISIELLRDAEHRLGELALRAICSSSLAPAEPHDVVGH